MQKLAVFIGRFQPFHLGHKKVIDEALKQADDVLVLIGSSGSPRTVRNPFTFNERRKMILNTYDDGDKGPVAQNRLHIEPLYDKTYNDTAWVNQVQSLVSSKVKELGSESVILVGNSKDGSSYYLKLFPQWKSIETGLEDSLDATSIRNSFFKGCVPSMSIPNSTDNFLRHEFYGTQTYCALVEEYTYSLKYEEIWGGSPYPVKQFAVDALVEQSGHVLLIKRKSAPGKGLWALPGGHLDINETMLDGALRELREETGLKVPIPVLKGSIKGSRVFDDPYRSNIGRVLSCVYHFKLTDQTSLPRVKGADDASKAKWVPLSDIKEHLMFDDHYHIIQHFLGVA